MSKYTVGIDFGTLSARAILVDVSNGKIVAQADYAYTNAVMDEFLPDKTTKLEPDWALQYPPDYIEAASKTVPKVLEEAGVSPDDVIGVGTDFTECSMLPTKADGTPLCCVPGFEKRPHAYVKLWKHHAAQDEANMLNKIGAERNEEFLACYGGKISSEWMFPKIWQILNEDEECFNAADRFMECADWITMQLTGVEMRNSCTAGYKSIWQKNTGYPSNDFFKALDPRLENIVDEKMSRNIYPLGTLAGYITESSSKWTGLKVGTPVAVGVGDAHSAVPGAGITDPDVMLMVIGTSGCDMMCTEKDVKVPGMCGICEDGILPGYFGYEAGQSCMGDHFQWFMDNLLSAELLQEAKDAGKNKYAYLEQLASEIKPGASGLLALDWWNGNRSVLVDVDLTGLIMGMTLNTKPEEIYKALIEAVAYGKRMIVDTFVENGVNVAKLMATGGIAEKSPFVMQTFADVMNRTVYVTAVDQATAMGGAMWGAVAAGKAKGGYDSIKEAAESMGGGIRATYTPNPEAVAIYQKLYEQYVILHDYFGRGQNNVMKLLKEIKRENRK